MNSREVDSLQEIREINKKRYWREKLRELTSIDFSTLAIQEVNSVEEFLEKLNTGNVLGRHIYFVDEVLLPALKETKNKFVGITDTFLVSCDSVKQKLILEARELFETIESQSSDYLSNIGMANNLILFNRYHHICATIHALNQVVTKLIENIANYINGNIEQAETENELNQTVQMTDESYADVKMETDDHPCTAMELDTDASSGLGVVDEDYTGYSLDDLPDELFELIYLASLATCQTLDELVLCIHKYNVINTHSRNFLFTNYSITTFHHVLNRLFSKMRYEDKVNFKSISDTFFKKLLEKAPASVAVLFFLYPFKSNIRGFFSRLGEYQLDLERKLNPAYFTAKNLWQALVANQTEVISKWHEATPEGDVFLKANALERRVVWRFILTALRPPVGTVLSDEPHISSALKSALLAASLLLSRKYYPPYKLEVGLLGCFIHLHEDGLIEKLLQSKLKVDPEDQIAINAIKDMIEYLILNTKNSLLIQLLKNIAEQSPELIKQEGESNIFVHGLTYAARVNKEEAFLEINRLVNMDGAVFNILNAYNIPMLKNVYKQFKITTDTYYFGVRAAISCRNKELYQWQFEHFPLADSMKFHFLRQACLENRIDFVTYLLSQNVPVKFKYLTSHRKSLYLPLSMFDFQAYVTHDRQGFRTSVTVINSPRNFPTCQDSILVYACRYSSLETIEVLLADKRVLGTLNFLYGPNTGTTALIEACKRGDLRIVRVLVNAGANINLTTFKRKNNRSDMKNYSSPLLASLNFHYISAYLIENGASYPPKECVKPILFDAIKNTPLFVFLIRGNNELDLSIRDSWGSSLWSVAVTKMNVGALTVLLHTGKFDQLALNNEMSLVYLLVHLVEENNMLEKMSPEMIEFVQAFLRLPLFADNMCLVRSSRAFWHLLLNHAVTTNCTSFITLYSNESLTQFTNNNAHYRLAMVLKSLDMIKAMLELDVRFDGDVGHSLLQIAMDCQDNELKEMLLAHPFIPLYSCWSSLTAPRANNARIAERTEQPAHKRQRSDDPVVGTQNPQTGRPPKQARTSYDLFGQFRSQEQSVFPPQREKEQNTQIFKNH